MARAKALERRSTLAQPLPTVSIRSLRRRCLACSLASIPPTSSWLGQKPRRRFQASRNEGSDATVSDLLLIGFRPPFASLVQ